MKLVGQWGQHDHGFHADLQNIRYANHEPCKSRNYPKLYNPLFSRSTNQRTFVSRYGSTIKLPNTIKARTHTYLTNDRQMDVTLDADTVPDVISTCAPFLSNLHHISFRIDAKKWSNELPHPPGMKSEYRVGKDDVSVELLSTRRTKLDCHDYTGVWVLRKHAPPHPNPSGRDR